MTWFWMLVVPAAAWVWHLGRAARGREYPLASLAIALVGALGVAIATRVIAATVYPPELAPRQPVDPGRAGNTLTFFAALFAAAAMIPLELFVGGLWASARRLRRRRQTGDAADRPGAVLRPTDQA